MTRYVVENPNINNFSEIFKKHFDIHKKMVFFSIFFVIKVYNNQYIRHRHLTNLDYGFKTVNIRFSFPQILELRIKFASCRRFMIYKY